MDENQTPDLTKMKVPADCGGCSHAGEWFAAIEGYAMVPVNAVRALIHHGWEVVTEEAEVIAEKVEEVVEVVKKKAKGVKDAIVDEMDDLA